MLYHSSMMNLVIVMQLIWKNLGGVHPCTPPVLQIYDFPKLCLSITLAAMGEKELVQQIGAIFHSPSCAAPSGPPTTVTARPTSTRSISVTWAPPLRDQQNGILRHYLVTLMSNDGVVTRNVSSIQQIISISGLRPYTLYNCTVQAETVALGPAATAVQVNTPQDSEPYIVVSLSSLM